MKPTRSYRKSTELGIVYEALYPGFGGVESFLNRKKSLEGLRITDHHPLIQTEIDFPLRQFLWFVRPAPDFLAYLEFLKEWEAVYSMHRELGLESKLPWESLNRTAHQIGECIQAYLKGLPHPQLFPKNKVSTNFKNQRLTNPMFRHSLSDYPLYTVFFEDPDRSQSNADLNRQFTQLKTYTLVRESEQAENSKNAGHEGYLDPYEFLREEDPDRRGPGQALLSNVERSMRKWSDNLLESPFHLILSALLKWTPDNYDSFTGQCHELLASEDETIQQDERLKPVLLYFGVERKSRTVTRRPRDPGERGKPGSGGHYWENFEDEFTGTEEAYSHTVKVAPAIEQLTKTQIENAQDAGEDPYEDYIDAPQAEMLFLEDVPASSLILNQHTNFTQQLLATMNQRIWWAQTQWAMEDIDIFMQYLDGIQRDHEGKVKGNRACALLRIVLLLGVDLPMALDTHFVRKISDPRWLSGETQPSYGFADHHGTLVIGRTQGRSVNGTLHPCNFWVYPIRNLAYRDSSNLSGSTLYYDHASQIAFRDQSGLVEKLLLAESRRNPKPPADGRAIPQPLPLFDPKDHEQLSKECEAVLHSFNQFFNQHASRPDEFRRLTIHQLQVFHRAQLMRSGADTTLVDTLNWDSPFSHIPTQHYYTHELLRPISNSNAEQSHTDIRLQTLLSRMTGLFQAPSASPFGVATKKITIGANELVKADLIRKFVTNLVQSADRKLKDPNSKEYADFLDAINDYGIYVMLWFCMETSHRPHHIPYLDIERIDRLHGIVLLRDKSQAGGDKYRLSFVSRELREQMQRYADTLNHLEQYLKKYGIAFRNANNLVITVKAPDIALKKSARMSLDHGMDIRLVNAKDFRQTLRERLGVLGGEKTAAPNFYRKLMVSLLLDLKGPDAISRDDIRHWLGHWITGTAPTNEFSTRNQLTYTQTIAPSLKIIIDRLGFRLVDLKLPRLPSESELKRIGKPKREKAKP